MQTILAKGTARRRSSIRLAVAIAFGAFAAACSSDSSTALTLGIVSGNNQSATVGGSLTAPVVVQLTDGDGKAQAGVVVSFTATNGATFSNSTVTTDANGKASTTVTLGHTSGTTMVTASATGTTSTAVFTATGTAGSASALVIVSGNNQTGTKGAALASALVVKATDQYGNAVSGAAIDWTTTGGVFAGTTQATSSADGTASASLQLPNIAGAVVALATIHGTLATATFSETAQ